MKVTRLLVLAIALGAGMVAAILAVKMSNRAPEPAQIAAPVEAPRMDTIDVLVAARDLPIGYRIGAGDLVWQSFPRAGLAEVYVNRLAKPNADQDFVGWVARAALLAGEPVREQRLTQADRGYLSAILSPGMRAIAVEVKAVSTAGGFVLPNDRVDVILTRAAPKAGGGGEPYVSETVLNNVRVLAVDQQLSDGKNDGKGEAPAMLAKDTVTLELSPRQAETLAQSTHLGVISLALRALRDREGEPLADEQDAAGGSVKMVRFGVQSTVSTRR